MPYEKSYFVVLMMYSSIVPFTALIYSSIVPFAVYMCKSMTVASYLRRMITTISCAFMKSSFRK